MRIRPFVLALCALMLTSCNETPQLQQFPPLSYKHLTPIRLNVLTVDVVDEYQSSMRPPNVEHLFPITPARGMHYWVEDRIQTVGAANRLEVIIKDASAVEEKLPVTPGIKGKFTNDQEARYNASLVVEMRIYSGRSISDANIEVSAKRSTTISEKASAAQRDQLFYDLTKQLMEDINVELEKNIQQYFRNHTVYAPGY